MKVKIKDMAVNMEVKSKGVEFEVRKPNGTFLGDLVLTNTKLVWCEGKTSVENGVPIAWDEFIDFMKKRGKELNEKNKK